jgi:rubrerythrin
MDDVLDIAYESGSPKSDCWEAQMNQRHVELVELFRTAIDAEHNAQEMYRVLAAACVDGGLRTIIVGFGREEARHERVLTDMYAKLRTKFADDDVSVQSV